MLHDPAKAAVRQAGRSKGGKASTRQAAVLPEGTPDVALDTVQDVVGLLGATINQVRCGRLDCRVANTLAYLASTLLRALQDGELEKRIFELERLAQERQVQEQQQGAWR
jgi:hypothetical protein